ncbi:hypothetical protein BGW39_009043 [Mortierella sp. 14UC]|nr:hypothetical protein BGW39_009043 [Mortierella sp. 14UC]
MLKLKVAILVVFLGSACTAIPVSHMDKRSPPEKVRPPSLYDLCIQNHPALQMLESSVKSGTEKLFDEGGSSEASGYIPWPTDDSDPYVTSVCFADPKAKLEFTKTGKILTNDGITKGDGLERLDSTRNFCPVPSILAQPGSPRALCTFTNMNLQAEFKVKKLQFKYCAFKECKETITKTATTTTDVKGEIKFAAEIFKVFNLEASLSAGLTNSYTFTTTNEQGSERGDMAFEVGVTVLLRATADSISIAGKNPFTMDPSTAVCTENKFTTKAPINETYVIAEHTQNLWIDCNNIKEPGASTAPAAAAPASSAPKPPSKRQDNQGANAPANDGTTPANGGTTSADAGTTSGNLDTTVRDYTYEEIFGYGDDANDDCYKVLNGVLTPVNCF